MCWSNIISSKDYRSRRSPSGWAESADAVPLAGHGELDRAVDAPVRYPPRPTKLDPYKAIVLERLDVYPELTAVRLFEEVYAAGYPGSLTQLKVFVRQVRPRPKPVVGFETPPGRQAQVDFAECRGRADLSYLTPDGTGQLCNPDGNCVAAPTV